MLAEVRRARYGSFVVLPVLVLCAAGRTPTEIATVLFGSRSRVGRVVNAYRAQALDTLGPLRPPGRSGGRPRCAAASSPC